MIYVDLVLNLSLLVALSIVSGFIEKRWPHKTRFGIIMQGILFGVTAILGMLRPLNLGPGLIFDGRSVMVSLCALFFGPWAVSVAVVMTVVWRMMIGGVGALTGSLVILSSAGIGLVSFFRFRPGGNPPSILTLYLFGLIVHLAMLAMMFTLPGNAGLIVVKQIGLPVMLMYPLATILAGMILSDQVRVEQSAKMLQASEEKYRTLFEESLDGIFITSPGGKIFEMNKKGVTMFGYDTKEEILNLDLEKDVYAYPPDRARILSKVNAQGAAEYDVTVKKKNGEHMVTHCFLAAVRNDEGEITSYRGSIRNITERRRAEEALRYSEKEKTILNEIANIFLTVPDEAMYGEVLAMILRSMDSKYGVFGFIDEQGNLTVPSLTRDVWNECRVSGKSIVFPSDSWGESLWGRAIREKRTFCSDGPFHTPEGHVPIDHFLTVPIVFGQETIGLISVANKDDGYTEKDRDLLERIADYVSPILHARLQQDILERKRGLATEALRESEEKYRSVVENVGIGIAVISPNMEILALNNQMKKWFPDIDVLKTPVCYKAFNDPPRETVCSYCPTYKTLEDGQVHESITEKPAGSEIRNHRIVSSPLRDKNGKINAAIEMVEDITERKRVEEKMLNTLKQLQDAKDMLVQSEKLAAIGQLSAGVAHEILNPINIMGVKLQVLEMMEDLSEKTKEAIRTCEEQIKRVTRITRDLQKFARVSERQVTPSNIGELIEQVLNLMTPRLKTEDVKVDTRCQADLPLIHLDRDRMGQVILNLINNALDAMKGRSERVLQVSSGLTEKNFVRLSFSDTGTGIPQKILSKIFDPFFTTKEPGKGTGLGLSIVYGIIQDHGGSIWAENNEHGGATFFVELPIEKREMP